MIISQKRKKRRAYSLDQNNEGGITEEDIDDWNAAGLGGPTVIKRLFQR